jgi:microbial collagenase
VNKAAISGGRLTPGLVECIAVQGDLWLSLPEINQHQSVAITVDHGQGNAALYFRQGNWPNASTFDAKSDNAGTSQCIYINNLSQSGAYWAYLRLTGQSSGSSIMLDFDTPGCRSRQ